ncbi:hypothetical protein FHG87_013119 [Trinorchestia longiramus]|nr:hypothetical protein FHG87_013119 [Trinorchestia longiramus]
MVSIYVIVLSDGISHCLPDDREGLHLFHDLTSLPTFVECVNDRKIMQHRHAERVSVYEQFFASLVVDTHPDHPDRSPVNRHHQTATSLVSARDAAGGDGELERIQELFPNDTLRLHDPQPTAQVSIQSSNQLHMFNDKF